MILVDLVDFRKLGWLGWFVVISGKKDDFIKFIIFISFRIKNQGFTLNPQHQFDTKNCCFSYFIPLVRFILKQKMFLTDIEVFVASRWRIFNVWTAVTIYDFFNNHSRSLSEILSSIVLHLNHLLLLHKMQESYKDLFPITISIVNDNPELWCCST